MQKVIGVLFFLLILLQVDSVSAKSLLDNYNKILKSGISQTALRDAIDFFEDNKGTFKNQNYVTIIDYSLPSTEKRMFIIETKTGNVDTFYVAHGKGTGENLAKYFSNKPGSNQTSLGFFKTSHTYFGKHGLSLKLNGLSETNNNALERAIVVHGATYVDPKYIPMQGRIGRSQGCPAVEVGVAKDIINKLKNGSMIYSYYNGNAEE